MEKPPTVWKGARRALTELLTGDAPGLTAGNFVPMSSAIMHLPAQIGDYTDFYSSREHATNVGTMFRGVDNALQPNWAHLPVGYHGRASSVFVDGTDVVRPEGQLQKDKDDPKKGSTYGPCGLLDFELEVAFFVGGAENAPGTQISMEEAEDRIFGMVLLNDWSARDVQKWEYVPLGPFCSKNWATSISPWVVTLAALEPFRAACSAERQDDPVPLDYLVDPDYSCGGYDIALTVSIKSPSMSSPSVVTRSNSRNLYWTAKQQLVHHAVTGCNMRAGDLLGSGTISGQDEASYGSMLELCWKGTKEVKLGETGEVRKFVEDGDYVVMEGVCRKEGVGTVGFGKVGGTVLKAGSRLVKGRGNGQWVAEGK